MTTVRVCDGLNGELPLARLLQERMRELGLTAEELGFRLGCRNPSKAIGRVAALCEGHLASRKSRAAIARLPDALGAPEERVKAAVDQTHATRRRQAAEKARAAHEAQERRWLRAFEPHAVLYTADPCPSQNAICAMTGGIERWLVVRFDLSKPPLTFVQQTIAALPRKLPATKTGRVVVPFFGPALGFVVNYSPDQAVCFSMDGEPIEVLAKAYRPGEIQLNWGGGSRSATTIGLGAGFDLTVYRNCIAASRL